MKYCVQERWEIRCWTYVEAKNRDEAMSLIEDSKGTSPLENVIQSVHLETNWESLHWDDEL